MNKSEIRDEYREKRNALTDTTRSLASEEVFRQIVQSESLKSAKVILSYMSMDNEIDLCSLNKCILEQGKRLCLPMVDAKKNDLKILSISDFSEIAAGSYGILEPVFGSEVNEPIDLAFIPGIAFSEGGYRIGYGKGYYDKLFEKVNCMRIGISYDFSVIPSIPHELHDIRMNYIFTEKRKININAE